MREIGLFNVDGKMEFYSVFAEIFKPDGIQFELTYRISKEDVDYAQVDDFYEYT